MRTISHRELRNNSSEVLTSFERLIAAGKVRQPGERSVNLRRVHRTKSHLTTAEIISDVRGDR